jgi:hypothetical protein
MTTRDEESKRVMAAAMRYVKDGNRSGLEAFSLSALQKAHYQLSGRDEGSGYRNAIQDRITELQSTNTPVDVIDVKPNFYGLGVNFNEVWRRMYRWISNKKT